MTVKLELTPDLQSRLEAQAAARGVPIELHMKNLLEWAAMDEQTLSLEHEKFGLTGESVAATTLEAEDFSDWD